jgi:hypothetical protein
MYWRDTVVFTGHGSQQFLGVFEAHAAGGANFRTDFDRKGRWRPRGYVDGEFALMPKRPSGRTDSADTALHRPLA